MKTTGLFAVGIAAALTLAACGGSDSDSDNESSGSNASENAEIRLWLNGSDTPQEMRDWLTTTFEEQNEGATLVIEEQEWDGLVERLTTSLASEEETPDVVEVGNTQAPTFTAVGAFADLSDDLESLGGADLLQGFVEAGSVDGKAYAVPLYAGSKYVFYRKDLFAASGIAVPTTLDEFVAAAQKLKQDNPDPAFSGFWFPGQDWRNGAAFVWDKGGDLAVEDGGEWAGSLSAPESVEGLKLAQTLFQSASGAPADGNEQDPQVPFCANQVGMMSTPGWVLGSISDPATGCPALVPNIGVFALPGSDGEAAPVLLGGSNIGISAKSQNKELSMALVELIMSDEFQTQYAENGLTPAKVSLTSKLGTDEFAAATVEAASNAKLTPAAEKWATVEGSRVLEDLFVGIAQGGDVTELAKAADAKITETLN